MIVPMKRLTLVCLTTDRPSALYRLRDLGVVHVTDRRPPAGEELDELRARLAGEQRALAALPAGAGSKGADGAEASGRTALEPEAVVEEVLGLLDRRDELTARAAELRRELARYAPFGEFDLEEVLALERAGVWTALAVAPPDERPATPDGVTVTELARDRGARYVLLAAPDDAAEPADALGSGFERVPWPERPLAAVRDELAAAEDEDEAAASRLAELAAAREAVADRAAQTADAVRLCEARDGMEDAGELSVLSGYLPVPDQDTVQEAAAEHGWGLLLDDPERGDDVPVLLKQSRWVAPVRTVFDFLHIYPGYWESDVGWVFLPFFSLFFAMIVGDAGYAVLLLHGDPDPPARGSRRSRRTCSHMMYIVGVRDPGLGRDERQLLRHPDAAAVPGVARGPVGAGPRQPHRPLLLHRRRAPLVRPRLERRDPACARRPGASCPPRRDGSWSSGRCSSWRGRRCSAAPSRASCSGALVIGILLIALFMKTPREFKAELDRPRPAPAHHGQQLRGHPLVHPPVRRGLRLRGGAGGVQRDGGLHRVRLRPSRRSRRACCCCSRTRST